jgi:nucleotide-binding universal stress UspA family protein
VAPDAISYETGGVFELIVVGTDGSDSAAIAVNQAIEIANLTGGTLHVVTAYRPVSLSSIAIASDAGAGTFDAEAVNRSVATQSAQVCERATSLARREGVKVEMHTVPGEPADVLVRVAKELGADLVVVGNRGMSGARRFVLGSVPNKVSHHCSCSLLIVHTV